MDKAQIDRTHPTHDGAFAEDFVRSVSRVEVIDYEGRSYTNYSAQSVELQLQDGGKTLKVFLTSPPMPERDPRDGLDIVRN